MIHRGVQLRSDSAEFHWIDVSLRYLRKKIELEGRPQLLQTVKGVGYFLMLPDP